eukprot:jgi/Botrbrau1/6697/Bobra.0202s0034.1
MVCSVYNLYTASGCPSLAKPANMHGALQQIGRSSSRIRAGKRQGDQSGQDWYQKTRDPYQGRTVREELEYRRQANLAANKGKERKDLYTDNWEGSEYKGSSINILTVLIALFILVPVAGLAFAFATFGTLWG